MKPIIHLEDKVAIVTGASRGIGEAIATTFAAAGASVVVASRKIEGLREVEKKITDAGGQAYAHACHTGNRDQVEALVKAAVDRFGRVDVLVNNAATNPHFGPMLTVDDAAWAKTFEVNVKGYFYAARAVAQHAIGRDAPASIVNVASVAGHMAMPLQGVYAMTKAAVISMTKTLAAELGPANVRVNAIAPGLVATKFASAIISNDALVDVVVKKTTMQRYGTPDEIAGGALYLASDSASFLTGHTLVIDGGMTIS